jgi:iron complex outermembrane receptor protein
MFRSTVLRGVSASVFTFVISTDTAIAQEALPAIDVGAMQPTNAELTQPQGGSSANSFRADANGNLPQDTYFVPNATTATKMDAPIRDVPQSIRVLTPQYLRDQGEATRTYEIARGVPGVIGDQTSQIGQINAPQFTIRGFNNFGRVLLDGMPRDAYSDSYDLYNIDHIEIIKGPSSTLYGDSAGGYGGMVNFITKKPTEKFFAYIDGSLGSFGFHRTTLDVNTPLREDKSILFRLNAAYEGTDSFQNFATHDSGFVAPSMVLNLDNGDKLTFVGSHGVTHALGVNLYPDTQALMLLPRETFIGDPRAPSKIITSNAHLRYDHTFNKDWSVTAIADYSRQQYDFSGTFSGSFDGISIYSLGNLPYVQHSTTDNLIGEIDLKGKIETGFLKHRLLLGLFRRNIWSNSGINIQHIGDDYASTQFIDFFNRFYPSGPYYPYPGFDAASTYTKLSGPSWQSAIYGQDLVEITDQLKLLVGGRYDYVAQWQVWNDPTNAFSQNGGSDLNSNFTGHKFSPRAGVVIQPLPDTSLYASWGQSFQPNFTRLGPGRIAPPETANQYDLGVKQQLFDGKAHFELALFDITRNNVVVPNPADLSGQTSLISGQWHSHGIELGLSGEILPNLRVDAAATFEHAIVSKDTSTAPPIEGSDLPQAPRRYYYLSGVYSFKEGPLKGLDLGASYYYTSRTPAFIANTPAAALYALQTGGLFIPNQYPFTLAPIHRLDLLATYHITDQIKLQINAYNLAGNANFATGYQGGIFGRGQPRSIFATLSYRFE